MRIKVQGGTARAGEAPLCSTCRHATVVKGIRLRDEIVECDVLSYRQNRITFPVTFCTGYVDSQHPTVREMEEIAWVLRTDPKRKQVGFVHAADLKSKDRYVLPEE